MLSQEEHIITQHILRETKVKNKDNLTRTNAYKRFYDRHPEMKWSLLASFVSRNVRMVYDGFKGRALPSRFNRSAGEPFFSQHMKERIG
nr:DUF2515 family protein [Bacillus pumilus]